MSSPGADPAVGDAGAWRAAGSVPEVTVLGVGNTIMADDGIGIALLDAVREADPDPRIDYVDGALMGMELLPVVQDARRLLVLDAVAGERPGQVVRLSGDQLPRMLSTKLSPHQVGLLDVFAAARLLGREPVELELVGVVPASVDLRVGLSPQVQVAIAPAVLLARGLLDGWLSPLPVGRA